MKYSYNWIQQHIEETLPTPQELVDVIHNHAFEVEGSETLGVDTIFDIAVLPDRAGDCLSHRGMAREIAGLLGLTLKDQSIVALPEHSGEIAIDIKSETCRQYRAVRIDGVSVGDSPKWLKEALESIGQKSINNVVDATNFVLFDSGQPVHAFDATKIDGGIVVRAANEGEGIKLLGGEEKILQESDVVIADYLGAIAIAGVKGGAAAEVTIATTSILIEVANFAPTSVRKSSRRLGLITDASKRFENNLSPVLVTTAMEQVVALILKLAGGTISAVSDNHPAQVPASRTLSFSYTDITRLLGTSITEKHIDDVLSRYNYDYKKEGTLYTLSVPQWRSDLIGAHDIAEEVGRVIGYNTIPSLSLPFSLTVTLNETDGAVGAVRAWALSHGYREVYTYSFRPKGEVAVTYGAKGKDRLRSNLSDGLKESYELNRLNAPLFSLSDKEVKLFEIGTVFFSDREEIHVVLCDSGTIQELPISDFLQEQSIDTTATLPELSTVFRSPLILFHEWSIYPFIIRDISLWMDGTDRTELTAALDAFSQKRGRSWRLFDEFSKEGRTSLAFRFVFQSKDRTLTDGEVTQELEELLQTLRGIQGVELR